MLVKEGLIAAARHRGATDLVARKRPREPGAPSRASHMLWNFEEGGIRMQVGAALRPCQGGQSAFSARIKRASAAQMP